MNFIFTLLLLFEIMFIIFIERSITPFSLLAIPFFIVLLISIFSNLVLNFVSVNTFCIVLWIICLFSFWIGGLLSFNLTNKLSLNNIDEKKKVVGFLICIFSILFSILILIRAIKLISTLSNPILISTDFYSKQIVSDGYEWFRTLLMIFLIFLIGNVSVNRIYYFIPILFILCTLFIFQIKGMILMPIVGGVLYKTIFCNVKIRIRTVIFIVLISILTFFITYSLPYLFSQQYEFVFNINFIKKITSQFVAFFNSGILGFSSKLSNNYNISNHNKMQIIAPFMNILRHMFGWERYTISNQSYLINYKEQIGSNVSTIFGTFYLHLDLLWTIIFAFLLGFLSYFSMFFSKKSDNVWDKIFCCNLLSILIFGWFEYYFWHQYIISMFIIIIIFSFLSKISVLIKKGNV